MQADCWCGSGLLYAACCEPFHTGAASAPTAPALMCSRYSAFAVGDADYLLATWHPSTRPASLALDPAIEWRRLQIRAVTGGGVDDDEGTVQFVAHYWNSVSRLYGSQHENSRFTREGTRWLYVEPAD